MAVNDHGLEAIRKSAEQVTPGNASDYYIKTKEIGTAGGNQRLSILNASDLTETYSWADFGNKFERVTSIAYTAPSVSTDTALKTFSYTLTAGKYRLDTIVWSIV